MTAPVVEAESTETLEQIATQIGNAAPGTVDAAIEIGGLLERAYTILPHGEWYKWLDTQRRLYRLTAEQRAALGVASRGFLLSNKTADNYRAVKQAFDAVRGTDLEAVFLGVSAGALYGELSIREMSKAESVYSYVKQALARLTEDQPITALGGVVKLLKAGRITPEAAADIDRRTAIAPPAVQDVVAKHGVTDEQVIDYLGRFARNAPKEFGAIAASGTLPGAGDESIPLAAATVRQVAASYSYTMKEDGLTDWENSRILLAVAAPVNSLFVGPVGAIRVLANDLEIVYTQSATVTVLVDSDTAAKIAAQQEAGSEFRLTLTAIPKK